MNRKIRTLVFAAFLGCAATLASQPARALPLPGVGEGVFITYYSDSTYTVEIGWRHYGDCGEPFDSGSHSRYFTIEVSSCPQNVKSLSQGGR